MPITFHDYGEQLLPSEGVSGDWYIQKIDGEDNFLYWNASQNEFANTGPRTGGVRPAETPPV